jgi:hypothetical protein
LNRRQPGDRFTQNKGFIGDVAGEAAFFSLRAGLAKGTGSGFSTLWPAAARVSKFPFYERKFARNRERERFVLLSPLVDARGSVRPVHPAYTGDPA